MIGLIVNPHSRKNKRRRGRAARFEKILGRRGRVIETPGVDAIVPALRRFADEGRRYLVADGGDGALHWLINEAVKYFGLARAAEMAVYLPTGGGSVDFVAKFLGLVGDAQEVVTRLVQCVGEGRTPPLRDVPSVDFTGTQTAYGDTHGDFRRVGFGSALGDTAPTSTARSTAARANTAPSTSRGTSPRPSPRRPQAGPSRGVSRPSSRAFSAPPSRITSAPFAPR